MRIRKKVLRKIISVFASVLLLANSFTPYLLIAPVLNPVKAQTEIVTPTQEPTAIPTESITVVPTLTETPTPTPTPTAEPTIVPTETPTTAIEITMTPEPTIEATPSATPTVDPTSTIKSASLSDTKIPLRKAGNLLKEIKKQSKKNYVEGEIIVKFKKNKLNVKSLLGKAQAFVFEKKFSLDKKSEFKDLNVRVFKSKKSTKEMIKELKSDRDVEYAQPNYIKKILSTPNDTDFISLWGLNNSGQGVNGTPGSNDADIDAPEAWDFESINQPDVVVAVLDTGVAYNHPDLTSNMWDGSGSCKDEIDTPISDGCPNHGWDYINSDDNPLDDNSHGTHVSGTIAANVNNSKGISGISSQNKNKIMAIKIGDSLGYVDTTSEIQGINFAKYNGAKIINASFGGSNFDQAEKDAIDAFPGLFIAAAGNDGTDNESSHIYPCDYASTNIICVAATDQNDNIATFSDYGTTSVDVGAPGKNIYSTVPLKSNVLTEDFEGVTPPEIPSVWVKNGNWGTLDSGSSGWDNVLYGDLAYPYANSVNTTVTSPSYNLSAGDASIDFWTACDTEYSSPEGSDYMALEYSNNDGVNFNEILKWNEYSIDSDADPTGSAVNSYSGSIPSQYLTSSFKFRFKWVTNSTDNAYEGCFVDNISITKYSDGSDEKYDFMDGTSMAAPHVAGLAALIEGYNSSLTPTQVKNIILNTGDTVSGTNGLVGKTVTGKRINALKALQSANFAKSITSFTITGQTGETVINESAHTIGITVPFGTNVTALVPMIAITGSSVNPASEVAQNFTNPITYTVTAADSSTQAYTVTVTIGADPIATAFDGISATLAGSPNNVANNLNDVTTANIGSFSGLYFEKSISGTPVGKLTFSAALNLSSDETKTFLQNLGTKLDQGNGRIALDVSTAAALAGKGAALEMYNVTSASESNLIVRDDEGNIIDASGIVSNFTYNSDTDTVSFNTSHFTQFDIDTEPPVIADQGNVYVEATSESGAVVTWVALLATDNIDPDGYASCTPLSGLTFPIGVTTITCTKTDTAGNTATKTFTVTVTANNPPSFDSIAPQSINEDSSFQNIFITNVSPGSGEDGQTVTMTATSSDTNIILNPTVTGTGATRTLTYTTVANAYGTATISVLANDGQTSNNTYSQSFNITVNPVNDGPSFDSIADVVVDEDSSQPISITNIKSGPDNESGQTVTMTATSNNVSVIPDPTVSAVSGGTANLTYTPAANKSGSATITVTANDGQASNNISTRTFTITVTAVNDPPTAMNDDFTTIEDTTYTIDYSSLLDNDSVKYPIFQDHFLRLFV